MQKGYKTTEFWLTLASQIVPILVLTGYLNPEQGTQVNSQTAEIIKALFALIATIAPVATYVYGRAKVKAAFHAAGK